MILSLLNYLTNNLFMFVAILEQDEADKEAAAKASTAAKNKKRKNKKKGIVPSDAAADNDIKEPEDAPADDDIKEPEPKISQEEAGVKVEKQDVDLSPPVVPSQDAKHGVAGEKNVAKNQGDEIELDCEGWQKFHEEDVLIFSDNEAPSASEQLKPSPQPSAAATAKQG